MLCNMSKNSVSVCSKVRVSLDSVVVISEKMTDCKECITNQVKHII